MHVCADCGPYSGRRPIRGMCYHCRQVHTCQICRLVSRVLVQARSGRCLICQDVLGSMHRTLTGVSRPAGCPGAGPARIADLAARAAAGEPLFAGGDRPDTRLALSLLE